MVSPTPLSQDAAGRLEALRESMSTKEDEEERRQSDEAQEPSSSAEGTPQTERTVHTQQQQQLQQQPSLPFPPGGAMPSFGGPFVGGTTLPQNPMLPPELQYFQGLQRAEEQAMMGQGSPQGQRGSLTGPLPHQPGGGVAFNEWGAAARLPPPPERLRPEQQEAAGFMMGQHQQGTGPSFPQGPSLLDPRLFSHQPPPPQQQAARFPPAPPPGALHMMTNTPSLAHNDDMLRSLLLRQEEERIMSRKRPGAGAGAFPAGSWLPAAKRPMMSSDVGASIEPQPLPQQWSTSQQQQSPLAAASLLTDSDSHKQERRRHVKSFPVKLMDSLTQYYDESVVAWLPDGKSFVVVNPDLFVEKILSKAFKGGKYSSFVRKLNRWGFVRLISGTGMDCFHHPLFQRDRRDLCELITCKDAAPSSRAPQIETSLQKTEKPSLAGIEKYFEHLKGKGPARASTIRKKQMMEAQLVNKSHRAEPKDDDSDNDDDEPPPPEVGA